MKKGEAGREELVSLCQLPLVLDPEAKARIMQGEALLQKQHEVQASAINVGPSAVFGCCRSRMKLRLLPVL